MLDVCFRRLRFERSREGVFLAAVIFTMILQMIFASNAISAPLNHRIAGYTQYDTSAAIAKEGWTQSDYAILAYGENYPDALAATPLAKKYNAPILLTERLNLTPVIQQTLQDLKVKNVFIAGGTAVISSSIEDQLKDIGINVTRLAGYDKYDTAIEIAKLLDNVNEISVVTGDDFADALSIASVSAMNNSPIILAPRDQLTESIKQYLSTTSITKTYVIGNTDQISESVSSQFPNSERISGDDKYTRNISILKRFDAKYNFETIFAATGNGFADALSGAAFAAKISAPIILVDNNALPSSTQEYINSKVPASKNLCVLGGEAVISNSLVGNILGSQATIPATPTTPTIPPTSSNTVKITNIDLSAEIVTIFNSGTSAVDLTGWKLVSEQGSQSFNFPSGTNIQAGESLKIVSGPNAAAGTNTLLWTKSNMWNNSGDPGTLHDSQGQVIARYPL